MAVIRNYRFDTYDAFKLKVIVGTEEEVNEQYKIIFKEDNNKPFDGLCTHDGTYLTILLDKDCKFKTIAHEAFHITRYVMEYIGSKLDDSSEEPWAYFLADIVMKCEKTINLYRNENEKRSI